MTSAESRSELRAAILELKPFFRKAAFFSVFCTLLVLAPTGYMLEVYDRVINSRNSSTLLMLTLIVLWFYVIMELLEWARGGVMHQAGQALDRKLRERVFSAIFEANLRRIPGGTSQALNDLRSIREFLTTPALTALMDAPVSLLFLILIYMINSLLGSIAVLAALLQVLLTYLTEKNTQPPLVAAQKDAIAAQNYANGTLRNAQVIEAMGMLRSIHQRWMSKQRSFLRLQAEASDHAGSNAALSKMLQTTLSAALLGLGAWLSVRGELAGGAGMMIVAWVLGPRVLAPLVQVVSLWKSVVTARDAYQRLDKLLQALPERQKGMPLPAPKGNLAVEGVVASAPGSQVAIIRGISFTLPAGQILAIVGPSASGKSTLARLLVGIWPAANGKVRLDGVDVHPWNKEELGPHIGYLPQGIELFGGSLAENIARFGEVDMAKVESAARAVGLHEAILALPDAYETLIGDEGCFLSGGQRQRVGLARAIYGHPRFVVLDEPNSSLDEAGEVALVNTLLGLKAQGTTLIVITHRTSVLAAADLMLVLRDGQVQIAGPRDEVLAALHKAAVAPAAAPAAGLAAAPAA
ncbi:MULTISPECIES: type I secretion system permease/ATPase [Candidatus Accumulibacter]|uniref:Type I secretion system ATPase n=1 Tax=Candidatus Accumulibacter phosphatis TaxID=327160 RepID=A0A5S4EKX0_9PROT|nr:MULTISPECIES: type I secretion system permease/ATPase [Candidatus Accumulibacter]MCM8622033.1 type I secretion system permease/ATPase [Accumulibacter sp.]TMQ76017.1 type I secretion system ATPase [Candidatus Accumulibacter phosphatis]